MGRKGIPDEGYRIYRPQPTTMFKPFPGADYGTSLRSRHWLFESTAVRYRKAGDEVGKETGCTFGVPVRKSGTSDSERSAQLHV
jgi:hypothetical protein